MFLEQIFVYFLIIKKSTTHLGVQIISQQINEITLNGELICHSFQVMR